MLSLLKRTGPPSVRSALASVSKDAALLDLEVQLASARASAVAPQARRAQIIERLTIEKPMMPLFEPERLALEAERARLDQTIAQAMAEQQRLTRELLALLPIHAAKLTTALNETRMTSAKKIVAAINAIETETATLDEAATALGGAGASARRVPTMNLAPIMRAAKFIVEETRIKKSER